MTEVEEQILTNQVNIMQALRVLLGEVEGWDVSAERQSLEGCMAATVHLIVAKVKEGQE